MLKISDKVNIMSQTTNNPSKYNIVHDLQNYMFPKLIKEPNISVVKKMALVTEVVPLKPIVPFVNDIVNPKTIFFSPRGDSLFWCFYVMKNGITAYEQEPASFVKEKTEKFRYIELLRTNKAILKMHRIQKLSDIEATLSMDKCINMSTFLALCALEQLNVVVFQNQLYTDMIGNTSTNKIFVLHQNANKYKLEYDQQDITSLKYEITHFKLPLKSISSYKLSDLQDICSKLKLIIPVECKKKQNIYDLITAHINKID
jgi:hypothetical protein